MAELTVTLDGVHGDVKLNLTTPEGVQNLKFRWYKADDESTGFISNVTQSPIPVTELAAEMMLKLIVASLVKTMNVTAGSLKVFNHLGEQLDDIEFMPPTFDGKEAEIQKFVAQQDSLKNLYSAYEEGHQLNAELLAACEQADILDDFLSLVRFQLTKVVFTFSTPKGEKLRAVFSIAFNRGKEERRKTTFIDCIAWGKRGSILESFKKGSGVSVSGDLETDTWEDKEGNKQSRLRLNITTITATTSNRRDAEGAGEEAGEAQPAVAGKGSGSGRAPATSGKGAQSARGGKSDGEEANIPF
jgi:single-stranded DNA-binding protein